MFPLAVPWRCGITDSRILFLPVSAKFSIVPASFSLSDIRLCDFSRKDHYYADREEHARLKSLDSIEPLDESRRIWRFKGVCRSASSVKVPKGRMSTAIFGQIAAVFRSDISRRRVEA